MGDHASNVHSIKFVLRIAHKIAALMNTARFPSGCAQPSPTRSAPAKPKRQDVNTRNVRPDSGLDARAHGFIARK